MGVSLAVPTITQEEVDYLASTVLSKRIATKSVEALDRIESPTVDLAMAKAKEFGPPVNGGYKFMVKGQRGQRLQWWDGADLLTFENKLTMSDMQFTTGKCHMGFELLYSVIEAQGIRIDYKKGIREGGMDRSVPERVVNIIEDNLDSVMYDWKAGIRRAVFQANSGYAKAFTGWDGLFPASSNTTGLIGGRPRSNPMFRHQLVTGIDKNNFQLKFHQWYRQLTRRAAGTKPDIIAVGDTMWDIMVDLFSGTGTTAGKWDYRAQQGAAMKKGEKYNVALPQNCFMYEDTFIINEPVFEELDVEEPTANPTWGKRMIAWNSRFGGVIPVIDGDMVNHAMPYNQRLERISIHGEYTFWCNRPNAFGILVAA
jgi:hypothetical protein